MVAAANRRDFLKLSGGAVAGATALSAHRASPRSVRAQDTVELRMTWWGAEARAEMMNRLLDLFEERNPNIRIEREYTDFEPYWERLSTQVAGGNTPDLMHFHPNYIGSYSRRNLVLDLGPLVEEGVLNLANFDQVILDAGTVDGKLQYVSLGNSGPATFFNIAMYEQAGVPLPERTWTWDDFVQKATDIHTALGDDVYGTSDVGGELDFFRIFIAQRGKSLFTDEAAGGQLNFAEQDMIDWFTMWENLRQANVAPPADLTVEADLGTQELTTFANGLAAMHMTNGNQLKIYQAFIADDLSIITLPNGTGEDAQPGNFLTFASIAISADSEYPRECAQVIDFMVNDPDAALIYNAEHGPPGSKAVRDLLTPNLSEEDQTVFAFVEDVIETAAELPPPAPDQYVEIESLILRTNQDIGFGAKSVEQATTDFFAEATEILTA